MKIGFILGSTRSPSNTHSLAVRFLRVLQSSYPQIIFDFVHLSQSPHHPLPHALDETIPAALPHDPAKLSSSYSDPGVQAWSRQVLSWDAAILVTPQYNWSLPGP